MKVCFVGAGKVGSTSAFTSLIRFDLDEIALVDIIDMLVEAEYLELSHAGVGLGKTTKVSGSANYNLIKNSDVVVVTAGFPRTPDIKDRIDLARKNVSIIQQVCENIGKVAPKTIVIVVTNPVDVNTYFAYKTLKKHGFSRDRVIGMGSVLDTYRLQFYAGTQGAYMIGEHGEGMVPIGTEDAEAIEKTVKTGATLVKLKGYTNYAPAIGITNIIDAIINDKNDVMPISHVLDGEYGLAGVSLGVPCVVGKNGAKVQETELEHDEQVKLTRAGDKLKRVIKELEESGQTE